MSGARSGASRSMRWLCRSPAVAAACVGTASFAADLPPRAVTAPPHAQSWTCIAMPNVWLPSVSGTTGQAIGYLNWDFARTQSTAWSGLLGYRALQVDFARGSSRTFNQDDMLTPGPIAGATARF